MSFSKGRLWLCYELFQIIFLEKNVFAEHYCYKYLFSHKWAIHKTPFQIRLLPYVMVKEVPYIVEKEQKLGFCPLITGGRMEIFVQAETLLHGHVAPKEP